MNRLDTLENETIYVLREAYARFRHIALLWSIGKDSTSMLWLARKAFFGTIPFPIIHIDTGFKFKEIYEFRTYYEKKWNLDLIVAKNETALRKGISPERGKFKCCNALKTEALKQTLKEYRFKALLLAIRRDEHGIRAKERYFSPRNANFRWNYQNQPLETWGLYADCLDRREHFRIHPMLNWREIDVWCYVAREQIPVVDLYFARKGKRYRSIGCKTCCNPVRSSANTVSKIVKELASTQTAERGGRAQDKEDTYTMQRLRSLGYM